MKPVIRKTITFDRTIISSRIKTIRNKLAKKAESLITFFIMRFIQDNLTSSSTLYCYITIYIKLENEL